ncbi:hypothetical protein I4U23_012155 [Adineta vaga]|nr:hypothetical protein I4U23_012155 [Adineta vaga]
MPFTIRKAMRSERLFVKNEIKTCAALTLRHMEFEFVEINSMLTQMTGRVGFGIAPPYKNVQIQYGYIH